jgi:hypothetical protein
MIVFKTGRCEPRCWYRKDDDDGVLLVPTSRLLLEVGTSSMAPYDDDVMFSLKLIQFPSLSSFTGNLFIQISSLLNFTCSSPQVFFMSHCRMIRVVVIIIVIF